MSLVIPYNRTDINVVRFSNPINNGLITATNTGLSGSKLTFNSNQIDIATTSASALVYTTSESNFNIINLPETTVDNSFVITKDTSNSTWGWTNVLELPLTKYDAFTFNNYNDEYNYNSISISLQNSSLSLTSEYTYIAIVKASITFNNLNNNSDLVKSNSNILCIAGIGNSRSNVANIITTPDLLYQHSVNITKTTNNTVDVTIIIPELRINKNNSNNNNFLVAIDVINNLTLEQQISAFYNNNANILQLVNVLKPYEFKVNINGTLILLEYNTNT